MSEHTEDKHVKCTVCEETFLDQPQLKSHIEAKHSFKCPICAVSVETERQLEDHMLSKHSIPCPMCPKKCTDINDFSQHFKANHIEICEICNKEFGAKDELKKHYDNNHSHKCTVCDEILRTEPLMRKHTNEEHSFLCTVCKEIFEDNSKLTEHVQANHTFECTMCDFKGITTTVMENHILEKHYSPDANNMFCCDECNFKCKNREALGIHFHAIHETNPQNAINVIEDEESNNEDMDETTKLKEELRSLKNNFERLESLFQDSLEEVNNVRSEYEAKLVEANDKFRTVKEENEALKEKVDVLFKLGRSYIDRNEKNEARNDKKESPRSPAEEEIETVSIDEVTEEDLHTWTQNKLRGFKRAGPSSNAENNSNSKPSKPSVNKPAPNSGTPAPAPSKAADPQKSAPVDPISPSDENHPRGRTLYCHYFSNRGKCTFEERTGATCRFTHKEAPMCQSGLSCNRTKCMYKHPNMTGRRNNFLDQSFPQPMNPWQQMMNPWWTPSPNQNQMQFPNPWNQCNPWEMNMERKANQNH